MIPVVALEICGTPLEVDSHRLVSISESNGRKEALYRVRAEEVVFAAILNGLSRTADSLRGLPIPEAA